MVRTGFIASVVATALYMAHNIMLSSESIDVPSDSGTQGRTDPVQATDTGRVASASLAVPVQPSCSMARCSKPLLPFTIVHRKGGWHELSQLTAVQAPNTGLPVNDAVIAAAHACGCNPWNADSVRDFSCQGACVCTVAEATWPRDASALPGLQCCACCFCHCVLCAVCFRLPASVPRWLVEWLLHRAHQ